MLTSPRRQLGSGSMLNIEKMTSLARHHFIRQTACAAVGTTSIASTVWNLRAINAAAAQASRRACTEFRALVCLFLYGGNDANNMIVPNDNTNYAAYHHRPWRARPAAKLAPAHDQPGHAGRSEATQRSPSKHAGPAVAL